MQFAAARDFIAETIGLDFKSNISLEFFFEALGNLAGSGEFAFFTFQRRGIRTDINA